DGFPIPYAVELIGESQSGCYVSIGGLIEQSTAGRQGHRSWVIKAHNCEWVVQQILALQRRIDVPPQAIRQSQSWGDFPSILAIKREVLRKQRVTSKSGRLGER